ncbi:hypothetical protein B0J14DRAFT_643848 [Halenospora varia]|nr:hypothetical protein B0J14DRAFT_643848 [Halenospora varia]
MPSIRSLYLFFGIGLSSLGAVNAANTCILQKTNNTFSNQEEVNTRLQGCTDIDGDIYIQEGFNGTFSLPGITQISGKLGLADVIFDANGSSKSLHSNTSYTGLKAVILDNLISITGWIELYQVSDLDTISMPLLNNASNLYVKSVIPVNFSLPQLSSYHTAHLEGRFSSISMPSLQTMNTTMIDISYISNQLHFYTQEAFALELPLLQKAVNLSIMGNFSSISLPKTTNITNEFTIYNLSPVTINLPSLSDLNKMNLYSAMKDNLIFPALVNVSAALTLYLKNGITSAKPVFVEFPRLRKAGYLDIYGPVLGVTLPTLEYTYGASIESTLAIDCSPVRNAIEKALAMHNAENHGLILSCTGDYSEVESKKKRLRLALGIGLGLGLPMIALVAYLCVRWKRQKSKNFKKTPVVGN